MLVLAGGASSERDISFKSSARIVEAARSLGLTAEMVTVDSLSDVTALPLTAGSTVLIGLHGGFGEDGRLQAYLDVWGVRYNGAGHLASAVGMDKILTKQLANSIGIDTAPYISLSTDGAPPDLSVVATELGLPFVVKPRGQGCSVGLALVENEEDFDPAVTRAMSFDGRAVAERYIRGTEITIGMLDGEILEAVEISYEGALFDHNNKFVPGRSRYHACTLPSPVQQRAVELSERLFRELDITDYGRIDYIVPPSGDPVLLEVNTLPGLAPRSVYVHACAATGLSYEEMLARLIRAVEKKRSPR